MSLNLFLSSSTISPREKSNGVIVPCILNLDIRWRLAVRCMSMSLYFQYPLDKRLGEPQQTKKIWNRTTILCRPERNLVTISTELPPPNIVGMRNYSRVLCKCKCQLLNWGGIPHFALFRMDDERVFVVRSQYPRLVRHLGHVTDQQCFPVHPRVLSRINSKPTNDDHNSSRVFTFWSTRTISAVCPA